MNKEFSNDAITVSVPLLLNTRHTSRESSSSSSSSTIHKSFGAHTISSTDVTVQTFNRKSSSNNQTLSEDKHDRSDDYNDSDDDCIYPSIEQIHDSTYHGFKFIILILCGIILGLLMPKNKSLHSSTYQIISSCLGYTYFLSWSISFYPQVILNYKRKQTIGLSTDFAVLNCVGFACYTIYTMSFYFSSTVQKQYWDRYHHHQNENDNNDDNPHLQSYLQQANQEDAVISVQSNDVAFAIHALILSSIQFAQILYYRKVRTLSTTSDSVSTYLLNNTHAQHFIPPLVSPWTVKILLIITFLTLIIYPSCIYFHIYDMELLDLIYLTSSIKFTITTIKYIPQVKLNFTRKSTSGWNVQNVILDLMGGLLSLLQIVLDSWNLNDFSVISGNWIKFGLGFVSILFDVIFLVQHYILYPNP